MKLHILQTLPEQRMLWTDGDVAYLAKGMCCFKTDCLGQRILSRNVAGGIYERILAQNRLFRHLFRLGIHHLWPLADGNMLVVVRKRVIRFEPDGSAKIIMKLPRGNKPGHKGVCVTPDGDIFLGEYALNAKRELPVTLYRSQDNGKTFIPVFEFSPGVVRHIHFVQWDPYAKCLWMGTGDSNQESAIYRSVDIGKSWNYIGGGSQLWRAIGLSFRLEALYWGTDAGSDAGTHPNYIMRYDRQTNKLVKMQEIQGPCHGSASLQDGTLLVSTGVEGGVNEQDCYAHLWASRDGNSWQEVMQYQKDHWPAIIQFGVIRFPNGLEHSNKVFFTCLGLQYASESTVIARII